MREANRTGDVVRFGLFRADFRTGELRKQGVQIRLQDKPFQLLAALVQHPGELVTRDDLQRTLWGDQTFVDFERSLNIAITKLRAALGDSADNPRFVETLPRRGYRFIAPLTVDTEHQTIPAPSGTGEIQAQSPQAKPEAPPEVSEAAPGATEQRPVRGRSRRRALAIGGLSLAAATAALVGIWVAQQRGAGGPLRVESLAVLPLENLSGDADQEFLADAVTDALITELGKINTVRVISRTSILPYQGAKKSLPVIGRELRVDAVVEGSVVRYGDRIRITAQLVHAASDRHLWAQVFERDVHDVLSLYDEVSEAIAREIHAKIDRSTTVAARRRAVDPEAWTLYMKGRYFWARVSPDNLKKARDYFQQAIDKQADFAMAYAGLADAYLLLAVNRVQSPLEAIPRARAAALKALELDHSLAEAHTSLAGIACTFDADWAAAERGYRRAFEINPSYAIAHQWWGTTLAGLGRHAEAAAEIRRALEIDPVSLRANNAAGAILYLARRYPEAIEQYRKTLELEPSYAPSLIGLGRVYTALGQKTEALTQLEHSAKISNRTSISLAALGYAYGVFGSRDQAVNIIAELRGRSTAAYVSPEDYALVYLGLREDQRVLQELERAADERSSSLYSLKMALEYDPLRRNPRFADLLRRVNLN